MPTLKIDSAASLREISPADRFQTFALCLKISPRVYPALGHAASDSFGQRTRGGIFESKRFGLRSLGAYPVL